MRILMLAPEPFFTPRGTPFSVLHRLKALSDLGHQVDLVTYPFGEDVALPGVRIVRCARPPGVRSVPIGPSLRKIWLDLSLYQTARRLLRSERYDVVHTHEEASLIGAWWQKRYGLPHLYDMHSLLSQQMHNFGVPLARVAAWVWRGFERWAIRHTRALIAICDELAHVVRRLRPDLPYEVIENVGVAEFIEQVSDDEVRRVRQAVNPDGHYLVAYIGTFEPYQGLDMLLEAIARWKADSDGSAVRWVLAGVEPERYAEWADRLRALDLEDCVRLLPRMSPQEAAALQKAADLLVSPRRAGTNTPLKIYSYLAAGRPILATRHPTHTQVLTDEVALLVEPSAEGLLAGLRYALGHPDEVERRARRAVEYFRARYSYAAYLEKTARIVEVAARREGAKAIG
ncbi:Alpha-monoglucosyldiacylglycerol synthase [bacterium HR11]|nr:Alpha-monoglucosyldiacylglycerol synthase [bacterium HR11]